MQLSTKSIRLERSGLARSVTLFSILTAGIVMRVQAFVYNRSFWLDESNLALNVVDRSFGQLATPLDHGQGAPVGFLWLSKAAILLLGNHDYILRLVPFLAALLSLLLMARLIQDIPPPASGYVALLLYAVGSRTAYYATEFKQYSTDAFIALLLLVLAMPCLSGEWRSRRFLAWAAVAALSLWFSHPAVFVVAGTSGCPGGHPDQGRRHAQVETAAALCTGWGAQFWRTVRPAVATSRADREAHPVLGKFLHAAVAGDRPDLA